MRLLSPVATVSAAALLFSATSLASVPASAAPQHKGDAAHAAAPAGSAKTAAAKAANENPVVATVNGDPIRLEDVRTAAQNLPEEARNLPPQMLFPMLVNQLVDQKALLIEAHKDGLEKKPEVQKIMQAAADQALQNVYLSHLVGPSITDESIKQAYADQYAGKPGEKEVHARHILVADEKTANDIIKQLKGGADFGTLAKKYSTDKGSADNDGGDLGWFKQGDMLPDFSKAAFAMKKGEISQTPVHTRYGYHVIQVLDTRTSTPPAFDTVRDQIRQKLIQQDVRKAVDAAVKQVKIQRFNPDGSPAKDAPASPAAKAAGAGQPPVPSTAVPATPGASSAD